MEREETVQRRVTNRVIATNPYREFRPNERNRGEDVHDHLRAPEAHLAPRQQVTEKRLRHQAQINQHAKNPQQFAWLAIAAVHQAATHVQVNHDEKH